MVVCILVLGSATTKKGSASMLTAYLSHQSRRSSSSSRGWYRNSRPPPDTGASSLLGVFILEIHCNVLTQRYTYLLALNYSNIPHKIHITISINSSHLYHNIYIFHVYEIDFADSNIMHHIPMFDKRNQTSRVYPTTPSCSCVV